MSALQERLLLLKSKTGALQQQIANAIGVSLRTYQRFEHGEREPTASTIIALAKFYGVSADYLLGLTDKAMVFSFQGPEEAAELTAHTYVLEDGAWVENGGVSMTRDAAEGGPGPFAPFRMTGMSYPPVLRQAHCS